MGVPVAASLLKYDDLKDSTYFNGHSANYSTGNIADFLGGRILVSSLVPANFIACFDSSAWLVMGLRRDSLPIPFHDQKTDVFGLTLSTRYALKEGRLKAGSV